MAAPTPLITKVDCHTILKGCKPGNDVTAGFKVSQACLPVFEPPVSRWAQQLVKVLGAMGVPSFDGPLVTKAVLPAILTKIPIEITDLMPTDSLKSTLDFLLAYDSKKPSWQIFSGVSVKGLRPSLAYNRAISDLGAAWPGLAQDIYREMAWDLVKGNLPDQLKFNYEITRIKDPTLDQFNYIDEVWSELKDRTKREINIFRPQTVHNVSNNMSNYSNFPVNMSNNLSNCNYVRNNDSNNINNVVNDFNNTNYMSNLKQNRNFANINSPNIQNTHTDTTPTGYSANLQGLGRGNPPSSANLANGEELLKRMDRLEKLLLGDNSSRGRLFPAQNRPVGFLPNPGTRINYPMYQSETGNCFYHDKFGALARKCRQPCAFSQKSNNPNFNVNKNAINTSNTQNAKN